MQEAKVLVVCVDYFSHVETRAYIKRIKSLPKSTSVDIVVVCNSGFVDFNSDGMSGVYVYDFNYNLGYMEAAHKGIQRYLETNVMPSWIILSNTDIEFPDSSFFEKLKLDSRLNNIIAPDIVTLDKVHQNPFLINRPSSIKLKILTIIYSCFILNEFYSFFSTLRKKYFMVNRSVPSCGIYAPHGSFIIFGRDYFLNSPTLEHPTFLYGEELHIAERARLKSMKVIYDNAYNIKHNEHVTTSKISNFEKAKIMKRSLVTILKEYY
ncbi:hypothetical protein [Aeromonas media]|uniref:hypothetical protein n=1 Tax=Aeromonas media TaxID=651 RepID=UPI001269ECAD|nr:hypothetical protein [Aeromonas media]